MPHDQNTKMLIYIQAEIPSTRSDVTTLIKLDTDLRTTLNDYTKKFLALLAAAAAS